MDQTFISALLLPMEPQATTLPLAPKTPANTPGHGSGTTGPDIEALLDATRIDPSYVSVPDSRMQIAQLLSPQNSFLSGSFKPAHAHGKNIGGMLQGASTPQHFSTILPALVSLTSRILQELESNLPRLLTLNPSRREAVAAHLERLSGAQPSSDLQAALRRWIENPRSPAQNQALQAYFQEVALFVIGQALLLKAWADRGLRSWSATDMGRLNWALSSALKPHIPLDRDGWQITKPNLYSWYNPSPLLQGELWESFQNWRVSDEGPALLTTLLGPAQKTNGETAEPQGYDSRFFQAIWNCLPTFGFSPAPEQAPLRRNKVAFSPTLRDGTLVRTGPTALSWVGTESSPFQIMVAELAQLWWGPAPPPLWTAGYGLEAHSRDQLALALNSPKPSLISKIAEMEACDLGFVLEEKAVRVQGRNPDSLRFREQLDSLAYFKKFRSAGTTLGDLQACVALSKLRPGGLLWWAREERLGENDGSEVLQFLLERGKLVCEWDFSQLVHSLPGSLPLLPKFLYLFSREPNVEERLSHRPLRLTVQGQVRSHVEVPVLLEDALRAAVSQPQIRGNWEIHPHRSPTPQREWVERWPDATGQKIFRTLEKLRLTSLPLANAATIHPTPHGDPQRDNSWHISFSLRGLWLQAEKTTEGRKLLVHPLPRQGKEAKGSGFLVLVPDESWVAPLAAWLNSESVRHWLEHHAERKSERWVLSEQLVKWIPVPKALLRALGAASSSGDSGFAVPLPGEWERLASQITTDPAQIREALGRLSSETSSEAGSDQAASIRASLFVRAARTLEQFRNSQDRLLSIVTAEGRVRWGELLKILPKAECVSVPLHPRIKITGSLPPHVAISRLERVKSPQPGVVLATEMGFYLHIGSDSTLLVDMLWDQLEGLTSPTWSELVQYLALPRRLEVAERTASDVLHSHGEQASRVVELDSLLGACLDF